MECCWLLGAVAHGVFGIEKEDNSGKQHQYNQMFSLRQMLD